MSLGRRGRLGQLLDASRLALLQRRLHEQLSNAPAHGLLSITLRLDADDSDWPAGDLSHTHTTYWAQSEYAEQRAEQRPEQRLALGCAMIFTTAGPARFSALQAAFTGLLPGWQHDDSERTGIIPAAHIGFAFAEDGPDDWPNAHLTVPAVLLQNHAGRCTATFSCAVRDADDAIDHWLAELDLASDLANDLANNPRTAPHTAPHTTPGRKNSLQRRPAPLADRAFLARTRAALAAIAAGQLEKIVLTRSVRFDAALPIAITPLITALKTRHPECTTYALGHHGQCFVGATPERLVALDNGVVRADALAGTAWPSSAENTEQPGSLKLQDDKNSREQQLVVDAVRTALTPLCAALDPPQKPEIMQLRGLQHLRTGVTGRVHPGIGLFDLIARLHPTPAVGGTPRAAARQWLRSHGDQRAAYYTGGIGWINCSGDGIVAVALRCACITGTQAELFAGAGIVAGSDPTQELAETEVKFGAIVDALQHALAAGEIPRPEIKKTGTS